MIPPLRDVLPKSAVVSEILVGRAGTAAVSTVAEVVVVTAAAGVGLVATIAVIADAEAVVENGTGEEIGSETVMTIGRNVVAVLAR